MRAQSGFTLMELMITIAIIATMSAITLPGFLHLMENQKLRGAVADLMRVMQHARICAAREHAHVVITFDPDGDGNLDGRYLVFVDNGIDPKTRWTRESDERIICRGSLPEGIAIQNVSFAGGIPRTRFNPLGFPNGLGGHVYLKNARNSYLGVHLNLNGNPRIVTSETGEKGSWQ
jgi:prepilin-type N-terminal cleavage/methylation domain-containing protein